MTHPDHDTISTAAMCRRVGAYHPSELYAAAHRLNLVPGVSVVTDSGVPVVRRTWSLEWVEELRGEIGRPNGERFEIDELI